MHMQVHELQDYVKKVPQITALFWLTKIFATTFGETSGDALSMSLNLGYLLIPLFSQAYLSVCCIFKYSPKPINLIYIGPRLLPVQR